MEKRSNFCVIPDFFSEAECEEYVKVIEDLCLLRNKTSLGSNRYDIVLDSDKLEKLKERLPETMECTSRVTLRKYAKNSPGIAKHQDLILENGVKYVGIVYLNGDVPEGETVLYTEEGEITISPETGKLLVFDIGMFHEGKAPKGLKYIFIFRMR